MSDLNSTKRLGPYEVSRELWRNGPTVILRACDMSIGREVAIKAVDLTRLAQREQQAAWRLRIVREATLAGGLSHPNIVNVYDLIDEGEVLLFAMEYIAGKTLEASIQDTASLKLDHVLRILRQIASALDYAHSQGVTHRDVKASNIIFHKDGRPILIDFGSARMADSRELKSCHLSPEQVNAALINGLSDQYSLGTIARQLLLGSGSNVVNGETPTEREFQITTGAMRTIERALEINPLLRHASCMEFIDRMESAM
jgi:serine/threonine protein kinase